MFKILNSLSITLACLSIASADLVAIYYDTANLPIAFAAGDIKAALEKRKHRVETYPLADLPKAKDEKKIILSVATDKAVVSALETQGGKTLPTLGEQSYALRTTSDASLSYWAIGADANGAMYAGLQMAENINFQGITEKYDVEESPAILKRGIKLNLPLDKESTTYGTSKISPVNHAIHQVWDMTFWTTWFDEMARNRYNVISIWNNHPFTSMIKLADYPDVAIQDVTNFDGKKLTLSIDEKIEFWRKVMTYAKSRGFEFYLVNWNIWTDGATGKYGITDDKKKAATSEPTIAYMRKCMSTLLETYPDLAGFGITQGEHLSDNEEDNSAFLGKTFGAGIADYAKLHPERKFTLIHRWHLADFTTIKKNFAELMALPNVKFEMSFKYSLAHMYSARLPERMDDKQIVPLRENKLRSWLTVRNDDFYYHNWGEPDFARAYINGMINKGDWFVGFYMGSDGYCPTRTFFSKNPATQGLLEVQRQWYMFKLWGRLSYNPATADTVFQNHMALRHPELPSGKLFEAWTKASSGLPKVGDLITGTLGRDNQWWPEACQSQDDFLTIRDFADAKSSSGSTLASIADTASGKIKRKKTAYALADEIEADALAALSFLTPMKAEENTELDATLGNLKAMSYLTIYYSYKIRGATQWKEKENEKAKASMERAYCWWMKYANLMDRMYTGMGMARSLALPNWHTHDSLVLKEYTDLGGVGTPKCDD